MEVQNEKLKELPLLLTKENVLIFYNNICQTYMESTLKGLSYEDKKLIKILIS